MKVNHKIKHLARWIPVLLWMGFIFILSHQPKYQLTPLQPSAVLPAEQLSWNQFLSFFVMADLDTVAGKSAHIAVYAILAWLLWRAYAQPYFVLWAATMFGLSDEVHQLFIYGRTGKLSDVLFDSLGALLAVLWLQRGYFATEILRFRGVQRREDQIQL